MQPTTHDNRIHTATLTASRRITPEAATEVRHLVFRAGGDFKGDVGSCIRVLAPGQFGARHHARLYSIMDVGPGRGETTEFAICVRRCHYVDEFNGERYPGTASNFLCDLRHGEAVEFMGPVSYPFAMPDDRHANLLMIGMGTGIAPFRGLVRLIYEKVGGWKGKVRLFYGARSGLDMLYLNDENSDLALYFDQPTFKAFQAVSPRPALDAPVALDQVLAQHAAEVWELLQDPATHLYIAGTENMLPAVEKGLAVAAGSVDAWLDMRRALTRSGRWSAVLY